MKTTLASTLALGLALGAAPAWADDRLEVGGFAGLHVYNDDNELGVVDVGDATSLKDTVTFGIRAAVNLALLAIEGELGVAPTRARDGQADVVNLNWRLAGLVHLGDGRLRPFALLGLGGSTAQSSDPDVVANDTDLVGQLGVGAKWRGGARWGLRLDARAIIPPSSAGDGVTTDWEVLVGLTRTFGPGPVVAPAVDPDPDHDGVSGAADVCPAEAEDADGVSDADGCPDLDDDGDHIAGDDDRCPTAAEVVNGIDDDDGCPDQEPDPDADGVRGAADHCPDATEDADGFEDADGCPDLDDDGDGVADVADTCPGALESPNGWLDGDGCADEVPAEVASFTGAIKGIRFADDSDKLTPASRKTLDVAAKMLVANPAVRLEISGHTSADGDRDKNLALSLRRADAVKAYFMIAGVEADRLVSLGLGPDRPVDDNATPAGRAANRRIEFKLLP